MVVVHFCYLRYILQLHHVHGGFIGGADRGGIELSSSDGRHPRNASLGTERHITLINMSTKIYKYNHITLAHPQIKCVFLNWLPWILRMGRPGKKITRKTIMMNNRMKELEMKERSSKSLLANVLDIDDDFRHAAMSGSTTQLGAK